MERSQPFSTLGPLLYDTRAMSTDDLQTSN